MHNKPNDDGRRYDFSRVGGFRVANLTDTEKAQLLHRVGDWAEEALERGLTEHRNNAQWRDAYGSLLEGLMKSAKQVAIYIDNDHLRWDPDHR